MKNLLTFFITILLFTCYAQAQNRNVQDKIEVARIAYLTEKLELTPEQAEKFWPVYREYIKKKIAIRTEFQEANNQYREDELSDSESQKIIDSGIKLKERELEIDKEYTEKFQKVITNQQIIALRKAEDEFRTILLRRLEHRKENHQIRNERKKGR